jgi:general stress protein YciG
MARDTTNADRLGGEYMIQDRDHMTEIGQSSGDAVRVSRQADQAQSENRPHNSGGQQGGERRRKGTRFL